MTGLERLQQAIVKHAALGALGKSLASIGTGKGGVGGALGVASKKGVGPGVSVKMGPGVSLSPGIKNPTGSRAP